MASTPLAPVSREVMARVTAALNQDQLADAFARSLVGLLAIDEVVNVDMVMASFEGGLTRKQATDFINAVLAWLNELEAACKAAWLPSGANTASLEEALQMLRFLLVDVRDGNETIWTQPSNVAGDEAPARDLKVRAGMTFRFLVSIGLSRSAAHAAVERFMVLQAETFDQIPLRVTFDTMSRWGGNLEPSEVEKVVQRLRSDDRLGFVSKITDCALENQETVADLVVRHLLAKAMLRHLAHPRNFADS